MTASLLPAALRVVVDDREGGRRYALSVQSVGLACCAVEVVAATVGAPADDAGALEVVEVMVVAGTVTDRMTPALLALYATLPEPRRVLSFGACATSGGPYWDSYSVTKGVDQLLPVDAYVPGCPPRPEALLAALRGL